MSIGYVRATLELDHPIGLARLLLIAIAEHANNDGFANPGNECLARETKISVRQVQRLIPQLETDGFLQVIQKGNGRGNPRIIRLCYESAIIEKRVTSDARKGDTICHPLPEKRMTPEVTLSVEKDDRKGDKRVTSERERVTNDTEKGDTLPEVDGDNHIEPITTEPIVEGDQGYNLRARETTHNPPPQAQSFSTKPNEYLPGLPDPRNRQTPQVQLNERIVEAQKFGVQPEQFRLICDQLLVGFGKRDRAYAEEDERTLNHAQKLTLELIRMNEFFRSTNGIDRIFQSWRENDYRGDTLPTSEQFMDHASLISAGRVVNNRRNHATPTSNSRPTGFGIVGRGEADKQRAAANQPTAEEIERVRAERRAAQAAGLTIQQWKQQQQILPA